MKMIINSRTNMIRNIRGKGKTLTI